MTRAIATAAVFLIASGALAADRYQCAVQPASTYSQNTLVQLPLAGTWIGDYDATANPAGTKTIPGLFGGSGNVAIPFSSTLKPSIAISNAHPSGSFQFAFDRVSGAVGVAGLQLNVLDGQTGTLSTSMVLTYSAFHTVAPSSVYPALTNATVPLDSGTLTQATAVQTGAATGTAVSGADGSWSFTVPVPVDVTAAGTAMGQPFTNTSSGVMVLAGTFTITGNAIAMTTQGSVSETAPVPAPPPLVNAPFDLPTVLPAGSVAHLLMNGTFSDGTSTTTGTSSLQVTGTRIPRTGDLDGDGAVGGADLVILLAGWGQPGASDLNGNGTTEGGDLVMLLSNWG